LGSGVQARFQLRAISRVRDFGSVMIFSRHPERLQACCDELNAVHAGINHAIDGIAAASAYADHFNASVVAGIVVVADTNFVVLFFSYRTPGESSLVVRRP